MISEETLILGAVVVGVVALMVIYIAWRAYDWRLVWWLLAAPVWITYRLLKGAGWLGGRALLRIGRGRSRVRDPASAELLHRRVVNPARTPRIQSLGHGKHCTPAGVVEGVHKATIAESGAGKGQTGVNYEIQEQLRRSPENLLLLEVKPNKELSNIVYANARPEDRIWEYTMQPTDPHSSAVSITDASRMRDLAHSLCYERDSKDPHWNSKSEELIPAIAGSSPEATINDVRDMVVDRRRLEQLRDNCPAVDNVADVDKEWSYIRSTATRHLQALGDERVRRVFAGTADTPQPHYRGYPDGGRDIVIVRPHEESAQREARFVVALLDLHLKSAVAAGHADGPGTKAILDEFASFLDLSKMRRYLDLGRGGRLQISYVLQGRDQLAAAVGKTEADSIIASTEIKVIGATSDYELAETVSKLSLRQTVEYRGAREMDDLLGDWREQARYNVEPGEITSQTAGQWTVLQGPDVSKVEVPRRYYHHTQAADPQKHKLRGVVSPATYAVPSLLGPEDDQDDQNEDGEDHADDLLDASADPEGSEHLD